MAPRGVWLQSNARMRAPISLPVSQLNMSVAFIAPPKVVCWLMRAGRSYSAETGRSPGNLLPERERKKPRRYEVQGMTYRSKWRKFCSMKGRLHPTSETPSEGMAR